MVTIGIAPEKKYTKFSPEKMLHILQVLVWLAIIGLAVGIYFVITRYMNLQQKAHTLRQISIYGDAKMGVDQQQFLQELSQKTTIDEVIKMYSDMQNQQATTQMYYDNLQNPYTHFLQYFLLPPLNIWKDKYTGKIDADLVWQKYLQENTYLDVNLISQRTDFFKNIGKDSPKNEIKSITVGVITEKDGGIFTLPIEVNFIAQTKRSFLLLVDKLSMSSNRQNISLLNEFFFHLRAVVKERHTQIVPSTGDVTEQSVPQSNEDVGKNMYEWVLNDASTYVSAGDIEQAIKRTAGCEAQDMTACSFTFREKMRSIPALAYTVWLPNSNKTKELKLFLTTMPPLINVKSFTFQKQTVAAAGQEASRWYEWRLQIEVYGKSMTAEDVNQIAAYLGSQCTNNVPLNPSIALSQLDHTIKQATSVMQISNEKSKQLADLRASFSAIKDSYDWLPGFKKATKLFELYRMLAENRLCIQK